MNECIHCELIVKPTSSAIVMHWRYCRPKKTTATPTHCANNWRWNWDRWSYVWNRLRPRRSERARNSLRSYRTGSVHFRALDSSASFSLCCPHRSNCCVTSKKIDFCRAMLLHKRDLCRHAVSVRPSVRPSRSCILSKRIKIFFKLVSPSGSHTILVFPLWHGNIPTGNYLTGASNAGVVSDSQPISASVACCERFECQTQYIELRRTMASWWH